jgi:hypothetical protein
MLNNLYTLLFRHSYLIFMVLLWGCSSDPGITEDDPDEVAVTFSAGEAMTRAGTAFEDNVPVKIVVYSRPSDAPVPNYSQTPYKVVEGITNGTSSNLSSIVLTGGHVSLPNNRLTVRRGRTYDFVVVVNNTPGESIEQELGTGILIGFGNGKDILSGRKEGVVIDEAHATNSPVSITFSAGGADASGNLPHLCSAVYTKVTASSELISCFGSVNCGINEVCFEECLSESANLPFSGDKMAFAVDQTDYAGSYSAPGVAAGTITSTDDVVRSADGFLLPYPLRYSNRKYNIVNIDFHLNVGGTEVIFYAPGLHVPAFVAGYRYGFAIELAKSAIALKLSVEPMSELFWDSLMGGDGTNPIVQYTLGSWDVVSWQAGMGGGSGSMQVLTVGGWTGVTWISGMGEEN